MKEKPTLHGGKLHKERSPYERQGEKVLYQLGLIALFLLLVFLLWNEFSGHPISFPECPFHRLTGYYCPGCGGTRALLALLHGQILASVIYHPLVLYTVLFGGWFLISQTIERVSEQLTSQASQRLNSQAKAGWTEQTQHQPLQIGMPIRSIYWILALVLAVGHALVADLLLYTRGIDLFLL